jgi:Domain of unknown function (DUF4351)
LVYAVIPLYLKKIAAAEQVGEQHSRLQKRLEMVILFLTEQFSTVLPELIARVKDLSIEQFQSLATSVFRFTSITDLTNWLDHI